MASNTYFESVNERNSVQISDSFSNYVLWKKGTAGLVPGGASIARMWDIRVPVPASGARPIVVFENPPGVALLQLYQKFEGAKLWFRIYTSDSLQPNGTPITYYVFIPSSDPEINLTPKGLFNIWDEGGKLIFDSDANWLKILDYVEYTYGAPTEVRRYPGAKRVGTIISQPQWYVDGGGGPGGGWGALAGCSGRLSETELNTFEFGYYPFRWLSTNRWPSVNSGTNPSKTKTVKMLVADVTKLDGFPVNIP